MNEQNEKLTMITTLNELLAELMTEAGNAIFNGQHSAEEVASAITTIQRTILETKSYVYNHRYRSGKELTYLWHNVFNKCTNAKLVEAIPEQLYHQAEDWGEPRTWIDSDEIVELVFGLDELNLRCEQLLLKMNDK